MGYKQHHAFVVTSGNDDFDKAYDFALLIFGPELVSSIVDSKINLYRSFMVGPDGSDLGKEIGEEYEPKRDQFVAAMDGLLVDWAEVQYGDDDSVNRIVRTDQDYDW